MIDLAQAFGRLADELQNVVLLVVGPDEAGVQQQVAASTDAATGQVMFVEYTDRPEDYIIEAAAVGIPAIGPRIYGISDAIVDGETGFLHEAGDVGDIYLQMNKLGLDRDMQVKMGRAAKQRVEKYFTTALLTSAVVAEYKKILGPAS